MFILWGLSYIYVTFGNLPWIAAIFYGLKPAVLAIVAAAVIRIGRRALKNEVMWRFGLHVILPSANVVDWFAVVLGLAAFVAMIKWKVDIIPVVLGAGLLGLIFKTLF
ncbi:MAG: chromate transporter [Verrucomicrobiota bacterium]|jgi:chromate transporter|nr:chromate transporter [Verrucomicrobiota bacterium]